MKWKQLFDRTAELRILPNFGDRLVYFFSHHAILRIYFAGDCLANRARLHA